MPEGKAIVYCEREYITANGKTAHGLVRHTVRYDVVGVVDSTAPHGDAGEVLDGKSRDIPMFSSLEEAFKKTKPDIFVIGAVSEGGVLPEGYDKAVAWALSHGLDVVSGLHHFISDDPRFTGLAAKNGCKIVDVRKMFQRPQAILHRRDQQSWLNKDRTSWAQIRLSAREPHLSCWFMSLRRSRSKGRHDIYWTNWMDAGLAARSRDWTR